MIMALVCVGFASCGSDDDGDSAETSSRDGNLVGSWYESQRMSYGTEFFGFLFESNGSGYYNEWDSRDPETPKDGPSFNWKTSDGILTIVFKEDGTDTYKYVLSSDNKTLTLYDASTGRVEYTLTKQ